MSEGDHDRAGTVLPPRPRIRVALARLAAAGVALLSTRAELLSLEVVEERERLTQRVVLVAAGGMLLAFALLFAGVFVIALFWETHRLAAVAGVALVHAALGGWLVARARGIGRDAPAPFAASLEQLRKDRATLEHALGRVEGQP